MIPAMTLLKLYIGVGKVADSQAERHRVDGVLEAYPRVPMTPSIARRAGRFLGNAYTAAGPDEGPGIGKGDAAIAAATIERGEPVLADDGHFETIDGVEVEAYR